MSFFSMHTLRQKGQFRPRDSVDCIAGRRRPRPASRHLAPRLEPNPVACRSPLARSRSGPRLSPQPETRMPGGVGKPTPPSHFAAICKCYPLERRSSPVLNGSDLRLPLQPKTKIPGGAGQPAPPFSLPESDYLSSSSGGQCALARAGRERVDDRVTDTPSAARGRRWAVSASLIRHRPSAERMCQDRRQ